MTKAYRVRMNELESRYFFNKEEATEFLKEGNTVYKVTAIYETSENGNVTRATANPSAFEKLLKEAKPYEEVRLEDEIVNFWRIEEIEIK